MTTFIKHFVLLYFTCMIRYNSAWTENYIPKHKATVGTFDRLEVAQSNFIRSFQDKSARRKFFCFISTILGFDLFSAHLSLPVIADSSSWTDRNRLAAETWRAVDEGYLDRTFGGQDWFKLRQEVVKKNYKSDEELYQSLTTMVSKLGDKYTRKSLLIQLYIRIAKIRSCSIKAF